MNHLDAFLPQSVSELGWAELDPQISKLCALGELASRHSVDLFDPQFLFDLSAFKALRRQSFRESVHRRDNIPILISNFFHSVDLSVDELSGFSIERLPADINEQTILNQGLPCIGIFNNNDCVYYMSKAQWRLFCERNPHAFLVVWDYDNHHWLSSSFEVATLCDCYVPSHFENLAALASLACHQLELVPCGVNQFRFSDLLALAETEARQPQPRQRLIGWHRYYPQFPLRNAVIEAAARAFPGAVGFTPDNQYNDCDYAANLATWSSHALSLVVPVNGDLPIRVFDHICAGGLPLVPPSTATQMALHGIPTEHYLVYEYPELRDPEHLLRRAQARFDALGDAGIVARIRYGVECHHITRSLQRLIQRALRLINLDPINPDQPLSD